MVMTQGLLPSCGKYEINPPLNNQMYKHIEMILDKTLACQSKIQAIIVGPDWKDTSWIPDITELVGLNREYSENSFAGINKVEYRNDMMNSRLPQDTRYWVFFTVMIDDSILERLEIPNPNREFHQVRAKRSEHKKGRTMRSSLLLLEDTDEHRNRV
jgi:hypothetical protein